MRQSPITRKVERNAAIARDRDAGMTYKQIADKYGISQTRVSQIVHREARGSARP